MKTLPHAAQIKVAHSLMLRAIAAAKISDQSHLGMQCSSG